METIPTPKNEPRNDSKNSPHIPIVKPGFQEKLSLHMVTVSVVKPVTTHEHSGHSEFSWRLTTHPYSETGFVLFPDVKFHYTPS